MSSNIIINRNNFNRYKSTSFKGHLGAEKYAKDGIDFLRKETCFFRDFETKNFVKNYIKDNFSDRNKIKILVGGCSTGEEVYTYSMMLDKIKDRVSILGFDLSEKSIKTAKSGKLIMQKPDKLTDFLIALSGVRYDAFDDSFLSFPSKEKITPRKSLEKFLFNKFFEVKKQNKNKVDLNIFKKIISFFHVKPRLLSKQIELKKGQAENCSFVQGDIMKLNDVTKGEKADVITFSNALYHMLTLDISGKEERMVKKDAEEIVQKFAENVKTNLKDNGLLVFGEEEIFQITNGEIVPKVLKKEGFVPLNDSNMYGANVWQKN